MDEIMFCVGCGVAHWVIKTNIKKKVLLSNSDNRKFLTVYENISNRKMQIPPILILIDALILEKWVEKNDLDGEILLSTSLIGYFNNEFAFKWLQYFEWYNCKTKIRL